VASAVRSTGDVLLVLAGGSRHGIAADSGCTANSSEIIG
jgi:hypothetical protein